MSIDTTLNIIAQLHNQTILGCFDALKYAGYNVKHWHKSLSIYQMVNYKKPDIILADDFAKISDLEDIISQYPEIKLVLFCDNVSLELTEINKPDVQYDKPRGPNIVRFAGKYKKEFDLGVVYLSFDPIDDEQLNELYKYCKDKERFSIIGPVSIDSPYYKGKINDEELAHIINSSQECSSFSERFKPEIMMDIKNDLSSNNCFVDVINIFTELKLDTTKIKQAMERRIDEIRNSS